MNKKLKIFAYALLCIFLVAVILLYRNLKSKDQYDFYRKYNDSLTLHVVGSIQDVGIDFIFDRQVTVIRNNRDSVTFRAGITERIGFYIKPDTAENGKMLLRLKNIDNPYCAVVDLDRLKVVRGSDMHGEYDSSQLFLDRYSVELGKDLP